MKSKLVYSTQGQIITNIRNTLKGSNLQIDADNFFERISDYKNPSQPVFAIGLKQNQAKQQIFIIYSFYVEYKFVWNLGKVKSDQFKCIHAQEIFLSQKITRLQIDEFDYDLKLKLKQFTMVYIKNIKFRRMKGDNIGGRQIKRNILSVRSEDLKQSFDVDLLQKTNTKHPEIKFGYFKQEDTEKGFFELLNLLYQTENQTQQNVAKHLEVMNASNTVHIHVTGTNCLDGQIQAFGSLIIFKTIAGLNAKVVNLVTSENVRGKGYGLAIIGLLKNEGWKRQCQKISLNCQQKVIGYYEKANFKFQMYNRLVLQFDFEDQSCEQS